jgi:tetratricopeptide (TPR) repeat protein
MATPESHAVRNDLSAAAIAGTVVQAGVVHGGLYVSSLPPERLVPRQLPAAPNPFVGRDDDLVLLDQALHAVGGPMLISAIRGAGGVGKTWLALHWAHRHRDRFPDGQLFVDLRGFSPDGEPMPPAAAVRGFLDALGVDPGRIPVDPQVQAALFRSLAADRQMLVVLDNAADTDQVIPLLPGGDRCMVMVTSRRTLTGLITRHGGRHVALGVLSDEEAHALLTQRLGAQRVAAEATAAAQLVQLCQGFPLALGIIASRAHGHPHVKLAEQVAELRDLGLGALANDEDPIASLPAVLSWSDRALAHDQRTLFALLGVAPGPDIGVSAVAGLSGLSPARVGRLLRALEDASLLGRDAQGRFRMHDLIRDHATDLAAKHLTPEARRAALRRAFDFYLHTAWTANRLLDPHRMPISLDPLEPSGYIHPLADAAAALAWFDAEYTCLLAAQRAAAAQGEHRTAWQLAWALDTYHARRGLEHDRVTTWQTAVASAERVPDPAAHALVHRYLGRVYGKLGQHHQAMEHLEHALELAELQRDRIGQAHAHRLLAQVWERRGDDHRALDHGERSLRLYCAERNPVWEGKARTALGWYHARLGHYMQARRHSATALALHRRYHNPAGEANTLDTLGFVAHHTGHHHDAAEYYRQSLALRHDLGDTAAAATTLDELGHLHMTLGQLREARAVWLEALELYQAQQRDKDTARMQRQLNELSE